MAEGTAVATLNLGFMTILQEASGHLGGYLVTNQWGRPLEFRLSTAVQPNRIQQILYGGTLQPYVHADLIGKTLVEKTTTTANFIITDRASLLDLRQQVDAPVLWLARPEDPVPENAACVRPARGNEGGAFRHGRFPEDAAALSELLDRLSGCLELSEPFSRIREAVAEARKLGVTQR